eukprot:4280310-Lingulodinium_polyedra.AAC.1
MCEQLVDAQRDADADMGLPTDGLDGGVVVSQRVWLRVCASTTKLPAALAELFQRVTPQDAWETLG